MHLNMRMHALRAACGYAAIRFLVSARRGSTLYRLRSFSKSCGDWLSLPEQLGTQQLLSAAQSPDLLYILPRSGRQAVPIPVSL